MKEPTRTCTIEGCGKPTAYTLYCGKHYQRMRRKGDPLAPTEPRRKEGEALAFLLSVSKYDGDDCTLWPFCKDAKGYGSLHYEGRRRPAHRVMCEITHGPAPGKVDAAHACGNPSCITPAHLRWATRTENAHDKRLHGTHLYGERVASSKLSKHEVSYALDNPQISHSELGRMFGVTLQAIALIRRGVNWKHMRGRDAA